MLSECQHGIHQEEEEEKAEEVDILVTAMREDQVVVKETGTGNGAAHRESTPAIEGA